MYKSCNLVLLEIKTSAKSEANCEGGGSTRDTFSALEAVAAQDATLALRAIEGATSRVIDPRRSESRVSIRRDVLFLCEDVPTSSSIVRT